MKGSFSPVSNRTVTINNPPRPASLLIGTAAGSVRCAGRSVAHEQIKTQPRALTAAEDAKRIFISQFSFGPCNKKGFKAGRVALSQNGGAQAAYSAASSVTHASFNGICAIIAYRFISLHNGDILRQGFEAVTVWLDYGNRDVASLAGVDVPYHAGLTFVDPADHLAFGTVFEVGC
jgi:hypothetical protein